MFKYQVWNVDKDDKEDDPDQTVAHLKLHFNAQIEPWKADEMVDPYEYHEFIEALQYGSTFGKMGPGASVRYHIETWSEQQGLELEELPHEKDGW